MNHVPVPDEKRQVQSMDSFPKIIFTLAPSKNACVLDGSIVTLNASEPFLMNLKCLLSVVALQSGRPMVISADRVPIIISFTAVEIVDPDVTYRYGLPQDGSHVAPDHARKALVVADC